MDRQTAWDMPFKNCSSSSKHYMANTGIVGYSLGYTQIWPLYVKVRLSRTCWFCSKMHTSLKIRLTVPHYQLKQFTEVQCIWRQFSDKNKGLNTCKKTLFPDLSYLSDVGQILQNKLPLDLFCGGLLFQVVNLLFNAFLWANMSKATKCYPSNHFWDISRGLKIQNQITKWSLVWP
jgi:hypothetical protein